MPMESQFNDDARVAAESTLQQQVLAASQCRRFGATDRMAAQIGGVQGASLRLGSMMNRTSRTFNQGLPEHFLVAVTATGVHALEFGEKRGALTVGSEYVRWDRATLAPTLSPALPGTPPDGQVVIVRPPPDLRHASRIVRKTSGEHGVPVSLLFGRDAASQSVVDLLVADGQAQGARAPIVFGPGTQFGAQAPSGPGAQVAQLQQLADLHARGVLTDDEFQKQKAAILGA
jgi:Short C-terminal domain